MGKDIIMENIERLSKELSELTILEAAELVQCLEKKWGIKAQELAVSDQKPNTEPKREEKETFDVILKSIGPKKIQIIKAVREITALGLKEAKQLVDQSPKEIKKDVIKSEASDIKEKLEALGAVV